MASRQVPRGPKGDRGRLAIISEFKFAVGQSGGFGSKADAKGPVAGYDKGLGKKKKDKKPLKRYLYGGAGSRKRWM